MPLNALFEPFTLNQLTIPNRFVMAPMTRSFAKDGVPPEGAAQYYARRVAGGVGLILTEVSTIERPTASSDANMPHMWGSALDRWAQVVAQVHGEGGLIAAQIGHTGGNRHPLTGWLPEGTVDSPSGIENTGDRLGEPMTEDAIAACLEAFADAARSAKAAGFDAVEIHGAHGGLIDQFFWSFTNRREDRWGGDLPSRARFGAAVIRAVRLAVGPDYPVMMRLSQWKAGDYAAKVATTPEEMQQWLMPLTDAGVDALHLSQRRFWEPEFAASNLNLAGWAKKVTGVPCITVGSVGLNGEFLASYAGESAEPASIDGLYERFEAGEFDLVAVGRALLGDADWVQKIRAGRKDELRPFHAEALASLV